MTRRNRLGARRLSLAAIVVTLGAWMVASGPSSADVTEVRGRAFGYSANVTDPTGAVTNIPPTPLVTLPPTGALQTASAPSGAVIAGPATVWSSGPIAVSTQGTLGPGGSATSSTDIQNINVSQSEVFTASRLQSSCTASETGVTRTTTVTNGVVQTDSGDDNPANTIPDHPPATTPVPTNPAPNTVILGHIHVGNTTDNFRYVFNEQGQNPDGTFFVNAAHLYLLGPLATGEVIIGHAECGITAVAPTTTTSTSTTTTSTTTTSTTLPATTTTSSTSTTLPGTTTTSSTTTTLPTTTTTSATTTTLPATTTTAPTTTVPPITTTIAPTTTVPPIDGACAAIQQARAAFNAQITAMEQSLAQVLSGEALASAIAQLERSRALGNAQFDLALANCAPATTTTTSTTTTTIPPTTTTTAPPVPDVDEVCATLRALADNPFFAPFVQALLAEFGCNAST